MAKVRRGRREDELGQDGRPVSQLGVTLRTWRQFRGMTQTQLATRTGLGATGRSYVSQIEHGKIRKVGAARRKRIASALDIPENYLTDVVLPSTIEQSQSLPPAHDQILPMPSAALGDDVDQRIQQIVERMLQERLPEMYAALEEFMRRAFLDRDAALGITGSPQGNRAVRSVYRRFGTGALLATSVEQELQRRAMKEATKTQDVTKDEPQNATNVTNVTNNELNGEIDALLQERSDWQIDQ